MLDGLNRYAYCHNNPVKYIDPTGNLTIDEDGNLVAEAGGSDPNIGSTVGEYEEIQKEKEEIERRKEIISKNLETLMEYGRINYDLSNWEEFECYWNPKIGDNFFDSLLNVILGRASGPQIVNLLTGEMRPVMGEAAAAPAVGGGNITGVLQAAAVAGMAVGALGLAEKVKGMLINANEPLLAKPWDKERYPGEMEGKNKSELNKSLPKQGGSGPLRQKDPGEHPPKHPWGKVISDILADIFGNLLENKYNK